MDVAKNLKGSSSHYINKETDLGEVLYWQNGYGVITIREGEIPKVAEYIKNQKEHHQKGDLFDVFEKLAE
jgi:putative transposase